MASSSGKRCLYEVLELSRDCTTDEIRSSYRRLALQRHPDKLVRSGVPEAEATSAFQELLNAYEVLSDTKERAWYDSHRNQILFSSASAAGGSSSLVPDLFPYFSNSVFSGFSDSGKGFYKVYPDLFEKIYASELKFARESKSGLPPKEAPLLGKLDSPYVQVTAFYNYWLGFSTVMDFCWVGEYDAMTGINRKTRRLMDEENTKLRKKARREYNETVRGLAEFVKKRDKRVKEMQIKRIAEMEKKKEEEKQRKKELEREKAEKARNYVEPEWARVDEVEEDESEDAVEEKRNEFYCVVCSKKFKSDKQWRNHEQSKKHKEKVAELREAFSEEDEQFELATEGNNSEAKDEISVGYLSADDNVNELVEQFEANVGIQEDDSDDGMIELRKEDEVADIDNKNGGGGSDDDETSILEAMLSGQKRRNKLGNQHKAPANKKVEAEIDSDELEFMEYNDTKGSRRNRGGRRRRGRRQEEEEEAEEEREEETAKADVAKRNGEAEEHDEQGEDAGEPSSHPLGPLSAESGTMGSRRNDKKTRRRRRDKRQEEEPQGEEETTKADVPKRNGEAKEHDEKGEDAGEPSSHPLPAKSGTKEADDATERHYKHSKQAAKKKSATKKENATKPKVEPKGRKGKAAANGPDNSCEKCGEQFESRTKLHKHLGDTGHASLKSR